MSRIFKSVSVGKDPKVLEQPVLPEAPEPDADSATVEDDEDNPPEELAALPVPSLSESILREADAEAAKVMEEARRAAKTMLTGAEAQLEEMRRTAYDEGFAKGHADGLVQGEAAGVARAQGVVDEAIERSGRLIAMAEEQGRHAFVEAERAMVELALAVAGKILAKEIEENPMVVLPIVRAAIDKVRDQEQITIRVHPDDYDFVLAARLELSSMLSRDKALSVVADGALKNGDCMVETPYGTVDARIDTQLELVKSALRELTP